MIAGKQINLGFGGSFHAHIQQQVFGQPNHPLNFSHRIDHLSFGSTKIPLLNALDGELKLSHDTMQEYQYRITVVPVSIKTLNAKAKTYRMRYFLYKFLC